MGLLTFGVMYYVSYKDWRYVGSLSVMTM